MRLQHDYCAAACQGQGGDCTTVCMTRREPPPPYTKYALVASCSKGVRYPADVRCGR
ncbi:MAG: hypothetical protein IPG50_24085 [Myxococcales bacterium]|nr:hypothetical protein [Myxococcales bacterium]